MNMADSGTFKTDTILMQWFEMCLY